jgi:hypothetical protein
MSLPSINPVTTSAERAQARDRDHRPPLSRLTAVELRKMLNTRSGIWVTLGVVAVTMIFALVNGLAHGGRDATYARVLHDAAQPSA